MRFFKKTAITQKNTNLEHAHKKKIEINLIKHSNNYKNR
jgi:hypothetical protein